MQKLILIVFSFLIISNLIDGQTIDTEKSVVTFKAVALKVNTVNGTFKGMNGEVNFDQNDLGNASFNVCIDPSTVYTENNKRDDHLRSEDFFFVETFPQICFTSTSVVKTKSGFKTIGNLTMRGVTKEVEIPFTFENNTFKGDIKLKRLDYEIGQDYGGFTASKEAKIEIVCVLK